VLPVTRGAEHLATDKCIVLARRTTRCGADGVRPI
jgi:hypothetical protein